MCPLSLKGATKTLKSGDISSKSKQNSEALRDSTGDEEGEDLEDGLGLVDLLSLLVVEEDGVDERLVTDEELGDLESIDDHVAEHEGHGVGQDGDLGGLIADGVDHVRLAARRCKRGSK